MARLVALIYDWWNLFVRLGYRLSKLGVDAAAIGISCVGGAADGPDYVYCPPNLWVRMAVAQFLRRQWKAFHGYRIGRITAALLAPTAWHPLLERGQVPI